MAELALGIVGIVPLIGKTFTTYRSLHQHLRAFRHYSKEFDRTTKKLSFQRDRFKLECWLLLQSALDDDIIKQLKADESYWENPEVNLEFERNFKSSYESCYYIIEDISSRLKELEEELQVFNPLIKDKEESESLSDAVRRFRKRVHVTVNRKKYEEICKDLRESNDDLTDLSKKIERLQQRSCVDHRRCLLEKRRYRGDWGAACKARRASSALHNGLQKTWSCQSSPHGHHSMRLFLDVPKPKTISHSTSLAMKMSLSVVGRSADDGATVPTAFHLRVDSSDTQWPEEQDIPSPPNSHSRSQDERSAKRIKRLGPAEETASDSNTQVAHANNASLAREQQAAREQASRDLACILDLCGHFGQHCLCPAQQMPQYIGYLEVPDNVRHDFYRSYGRLQTDENVPVTALLESFDPRDLDYPQLLKLARTVSIAALTYFDTPWMRDMWRLRDISLLFSSNQDTQAILNTLHLEVDLMARSKRLLAPPNDSSAMDMVLTPDSAVSLSDDDLLDKGIFNKTLHSLGVALVGIETAQDLDPSNSVDVRNVRRYARGSRFGPKYKAVVDKCFGYNCDLNKQNSHRQVFECIVGSLEDMVADMKLEDTD